jgi:hypothetical protein
MCIEQLLSSCDARPLVFFLEHRGTNEMIKHTRNKGNVDFLE